MRTAPYMNTLWLRRLIRRHDVLGHLIAGMALLCHWFFVRRRNDALRLTAVLIALLIWCAAHPGAAHFRRTLAAYQVADLGTLPDGRFSVPTAMNSAGQVVGWTFMQDQSIHAFLWQNGKMQDLGTLGGSTSEATAVNESGQIVGVSQYRHILNHAFGWQNGRMRDLSPRSDDYNEALGLNDAGQTVGLMLNDAGDPRAVIWQPDGKMKDLGTLPGHHYAVAVGINNRGEILGDSIADYETWRPFLYRDGVMKPLPMPGRNGFAIGLNDAGQATGVFETGREDYHAFLSQDGKAVDLGTLGGADSFAQGIGPEGQVVGLAATRREEFHAFLWQNGRMTDLNDLLPDGSGWKLFVAAAVNRRGQIVGIGARGGQIRAYLLTP